MGSFTYCVDPNWKHHKTKQEFLGQLWGCTTAYGLYDCPVDRSRCFESFVTTTKPTRLVDSAAEEAA